LSGGLDYDRKINNFTLKGGVKLKRDNMSKNKKGGASAIKEILRKL